MTVEMTGLLLSPSEKSKYQGCFFLDQDLRIKFDIKEDGVHFQNILEDREEKVNLFNQWISNEKERKLYEEYILNYFKEIDKINDITSFEGEIIQEEKVRDQPNSPMRYSFEVKYNNLPHDVFFTFVPSWGLDMYQLQFHIPIPINSKGQINAWETMNDILEYETIQRMWEPFRDKTKYKLDLFYMLR